MQRSTRTLHSRAYLYLKILFNDDNIFIFILASVLIIMSLR